MDRFIAGFPGVVDDDLMLCNDHGVAYQRDHSQLVEYDEHYFNKCAGYEGLDIALKINAGRMALVQKHFGNGAVLDIGVGSGEFIKRRPMTWGVDVNPAAIEWLKARKSWSDDIAGFRAYTFWDVIEHVPTPEDYLQHIRSGGYLFTSIPIFEDLARIRESKHYRPGEHLYYWTPEGLIEWMDLHGFNALEFDDFESRAGRESIYSFAFQRR